MMEKCIRSTIGNCGQSRYHTSVLRTARRIILNTWDTLKLRCSRATPLPLLLNLIHSRENETITPHPHPTTALHNIRLVKSPLSPLRGIGDLLEIADQRFARREDRVCSQEWTMRWIERCGQRVVTRRGDVEVKMRSAMRMTT